MVRPSRSRAIIAKTGLDTIGGEEAEGRGLSNRQHDTFPTVIQRQPEFVHVMITATQELPGGEHLGRARCIREVVQQDQQTFRLATERAILRPPSHP